MPDFPGPIVEILYIVSTEFDRSSPFALILEEALPTAGLLLAVSRSGWRSVHSLLVNGLRPWPTLADLAVQRGGAVSDVRPAARSAPPKRGRAAAGGDMKTTRTSSFQYTPSYKTDVRKTFERVRRQMHKDVENVSPAPAAPVSITALAKRKAAGRG